MRKSSAKKMAALGLMAGLLFTSCAPKKANTSSATATSTSVKSVAATTTTTGGTGDPTTIAVIPTTLGARNFDEINATMETLTGVAGNNTVIRRFTALKAQLPTDNDIKSFSFSAQGAVTVLAAEYCSALVTNSGGAYTAQLASAIGNFNIAAIPTVALAGTAPSALAQSLIIKFWGSGYAAYPSATTAQTNVMKLLTDLTAGQANTTTTTRNAVIGACTSVLASAPVSTY